MTVAQESQDAEARLSTAPSSSPRLLRAPQLPPESPPKPGTFFHRVIVLLKHDEGKQDLFKNFPFKATVQIENNYINIDGGENEGFWSYNFYYFERLVIEETSVTMKMTGVTITLEFGIQRPPKISDTERFAHAIFDLIPDHAVVERKIL